MFGAQAILVTYIVSPVQCQIAGLVVVPVTSPHASSLPVTASLDHVPASTRQRVTSY